MVEHLMAAVGLTDLVGNYGIVAGTRSRRKAQVEMRCVNLVNLDAVDFGKLFHAALHLHGLGGLVAEALDESLGVGNLFLLVGVSAHLLFNAFLAQLDIF